MKLLLLLLALGLTGASPVLDNKVCQPHSRPWQAFLRSPGSSCSGALIDEWWIVSSFDCTWGARPQDFTATLGDHDLSADDGSEQNLQVSDIIIHSPYRSPLHSLALIRLAQPAQLNQKVQPIPLASRCPRPGQTCQVSGWGSTGPNRSVPDRRLKCLSVPVVDDQTCMNSFPEFVYWSPGMICAGRADTDNCLTDNGGVMACDGELQGVQWFSHGCSDPADPSVYTKLCQYNAWIRQVMGSYLPAASTFSPHTDFK